MLIMTKWVNESESVKCKKIIQYLVEEKLISISNDKRWKRIYKNISDRLYCSTIV